MDFNDFFSTKKNTHTQKHRKKYGILTLFLFPIVKFYCQSLISGQWLVVGSGGGGVGGHKVQQK